MRLVIAVSLLVGCIEPDLVVCDDGTACPATYRCAPSGGCQAPDEVLACMGHDDGDACTRGPDHGVCHAGACVISRCGNGTIESPEVCDDGNTLSGDGCNGTCSSDEQCGNGIAENAEECDCGDASHPGGPGCGGTSNGGTVCSADCALRRCGTGTVDPGEMCDDNNNVPGDGCSADCLSTEVCGNGIVDFFVGEQCEPMLDPTCETDCTLPRCGNGFMDADEVCDDGNNDPGDGCSFDCHSNETCGNGIPDYFAGEQCDDANEANRDGCASTCEREPFEWTSIVHAIGPKRFPSMTYDPANRRVLLFGGATGSGASSADTDETWSYDGAWTRLAVGGPAAREAPALAYDSARGRYVMFGGGTLGNSATSDTWTFDGTRWTQVLSAGIVVSRKGPFTAYDSKRKRVMMFGGSQFSSELRDLYAFDGSTWTQITAPNGPLSATYGGMVYDPVRDRLVVFTYQSTYEFDGTSWSTTPITTTMLPRQQAMMAYDAIRKRIVLFGGYDLQGGILTEHDDTWELDPTTTAWVETTGATKPTARHGAGFAYSIDRGKIVMYGGVSSESPDQTFSDTWEYDGTWTLRTAPALPAPRQAPNYAYDDARAALVMFGGFSNGVLDETWERRGFTWKPVSPSPRPSPRIGGGMVFDSLRKRMILVGGMTGNNVALGDVWSWDGTTWTQLPSGPSARSNMPIAYDSVRDRVVVFSGQSAGANDTWELAGSTWTMRTPASMPSFNGSATMTFDASRGRTVMWQYNQTWEWDGTNWSPKTTAHAPTHRTGQQLAYNADRKRVTLVGGNDGQARSDVWEYDGTDWHEVLAAGALGSGEVMAYDRVRGRFVVGSDTSLSQTAEGGYTPLVTTESCSSKIDADGDGAIGCMDSDCAAACTRCGNGTCEPVENSRVCPADCPLAAPICGDSYCDPGETCLGDC